MTTKTYAELGTLASVSASFLIAAWDPAGPGPLKTAQASVFKTYFHADLGTAAYVNTGVSGSVIPKLDGANTWSAKQIFNNGAVLNPSGANQVVVGGPTFTDTSAGLGVFSRSDVVSQPAIIWFNLSGTAQGGALLTADQTGWSGAAAAMVLGYVNSSGRSLNAGGTLNASGADYAEYMTKAPGCGTIQAGDVCGVDEHGQLTDRFADAHSFVIKSTSPAYVGGDTWGSVETLGERPSEDDPAFAEWQARHEAARAAVDRIAFSGRVPVNVLSAKVGDYLIPVDAGGAITAEPVTSPGFDQYRMAVGRVWAILADGRASVAVKVG